MIAEMAVSLARALDLPNGEIERIRTASLLHDLGKLAIPDEILTNPGELTDPEWRVVSEHPKIGQVVLEQAGALRDAATIVLHHHEWYDGRGYPHGLSGQEIPVGARIVAIADAYEAMVAGRPVPRRDQPRGGDRRAPPPRRDPVRPRPRPAVRACSSPTASRGDPTQHDFAHAHPHPGDPRTHAQIHDDLHDRRRMAVPPDDADLTAARGPFGPPLPRVARRPGRPDRWTPDRDQRLTMRGIADRPAPPPPRPAGRPWSLPRVGSRGRRPARAGSIRGCRSSACSTPPPGTTGS